jgi:hypothetical protein
MRWRLGEADVERLVAARDLQHVVGGQADGTEWVERARRTLATARDIAADDPESAFVLAYDAARHASAGLLAHQGLRATSQGGHKAVEDTVRAQFGEPFKPFGMLRRRRNELEYPAFPGERIDADEVDEALTVAATIVDAAAALLPSLGLY